MIHKKNGSPENETKKTSGYKVSVKRSLIAGIMCAVIFAVFLIFKSPIFDVKSIEIIGNSMNTDDVVIKTSGIKKGNGIMNIDVDAAEAKILQLKNVASVKIERNLPSKVIIEIEEKIEMAYVPMGKEIAVPKPVESKQPSADSSAAVTSGTDIIGKAWSKYAGIDQDGKVVAIVNKATLNVPVITGVEIENAEKGQFIKLKDASYAKEKNDLMYSILNELKKQDIIDEIAEINLSDIKNIYMILTTDTLVNFGEDGDEDGDNIEYKIAFLKPILAEPRQNGGVIELSDTDNVTERATR